jgi:hypothetical protein
MKRPQLDAKRSDAIMGSLTVSDPDVCLGAELRKVTLENGVEAWSMSPSKHVQEAIKNVKNCHQEKEPGRPWLNKGMGLPRWR